MYDYRDRREAGKKLGLRLQEFAGQEEVLIVALPPGGVRVGYEVARALRVPMEVLPVCRLGAPKRPEFAIGAITRGDVRFEDRDVTSRLGISSADVARVAETERVELSRCEHVYRGDRAFPEVRTKTVILVDDGLATGATMNAAVMAMRKFGAARVIVAIPVAASDSYGIMRATADSVVCPITHFRFGSVSEWYDDYSDISDAEIRELSTTEQ